jgi:osmoprotectant transport system ATP-binding protein
MSAAVEFRDVSYITKQGRILLHNISLAMEEGTVTAILGRSGSGKTTLLRTVNRMIEPTGGEVRVREKDVQATDVISLRRGIGYVIQETGLFPHCTVERNAGMVLEVAGHPNAERIRRSHELLNAVGLEPSQFATRYPHQLSGGQRQRVGLARALAAEPEVLLMDEPFGALDPLTRADMQDMLLQLLRGDVTGRRTTVLLVTHDLDEAMYLADRIVLMESGKLVANLSPSEFLPSQQPEVVAYVQAFHRGERNGKAHNACTRTVSEDRP